MNGLAVNGLAMNGLAVNGLAMNGLAMNGLVMNGLAIERPDGRQPVRPADPAVPQVPRLLRPRPAAEPHVEDQGRHELHLPGPARARAAVGRRPRLVRRLLPALGLGLPPGPRRRRRGRPRDLDARAQPRAGPTWSELLGYTQREATYFGNLFISGQPRYLCLPPGQKDDQRVCGDSMDDCPMTVLRSCEQDLRLPGAVRRFRPLQRRRESGQGQTYLESVTVFLPK